MKIILKKKDIAGRDAVLKLIAKKTTCMYINGRDTPQEIKVDNSNLEFVQNFKYLGTIKENDGSCTNLSEQELPWPNKK